MSERDELVARLNRADEYEPLGHDGWVAADQIERDGREIERMRDALHYYAEQFCEMGPYWEGCMKLTEEQCSGCLARAALNPEGEATSGSSKWGPQFPPSSCTAYEDCVHDGVCHDPNCGAPSQHGEGEA